MKWQYKTILFEFQKDGLLGDRYIDDDQMQRECNEQGGRGWELVNVVPVQDGLLSFFKRSFPQPANQTSGKAVEKTALPVTGSTPPSRPAQKRPAPAKRAAAVPAKKQSGASPRPSDVVGDIKIS